MTIIRLSIKTEEQLAETLGDFLVGIMGAAVEFEVEDGRAQTVLHGYLTRESCSDEECTAVRERVQAHAREMAEVFGVAAPEIRLEVLPDQDWSKSWKAHFRPFTIVPGLVIAPTWEPYEPTDDEKVIVMDPGMAFGTGHHATTKLCLELLQSVAGRVGGNNMLDVGTGTGVLGMAAVLWGAARVMAVDNDPEAVAAASNNVERNHLAQRMEVSGVSLQAITEQFGLVAANIVHDVLLDLAGALDAVTKPGGALILSGLLYGQQTENLKHCFTEKGFRLLQETCEGEWGALLFEKG